MKQSGVADVCMSCKLLLEQQQFSQIVSLIKITHLEINNQDDAILLLEVLRQLPGKYLLETIDISLLYSQALSQAQQIDELLEFTAVTLKCFSIVHTAPIAVVRSLGLIDVNRQFEARVLLEEAIPHLHGEMLGLAWTRLGLAQFQTNEPWLDAFQQARSLLSGINLGRALLNEGACFAESERHSDARNSWLEALPCFQSHPRLLAWTHYNLGLSALRALEPEAEYHFLEGVRLTKNPKAASMRASILNGLGASRRVLGEWHRAEFAYRHALQMATDLSDREESHLGLARTLRLSGRPAEALETLELALHIYDTETPIVNVAKSMAFLALNDPIRAKIALEKAGRLVSVSDQWLGKIAGAEIARREGRLTDAVDLLEGLPVHTLHPREEVRQFPKLFEHLALAEKPVPLPLEYVSRTVVRVMAQGVLRVFINDRKLELAPTSRPAELLVFLLEQNGMASLESLIDALFPDANSSADHNRARKAIWTFSDQLRNALGWQNAVQSLRGAYMLDQDVTWQYDISEARAAGIFHGGFLKGVYSGWVQETAQMLEELPNQANFKRDLN